MLTERICMPRAVVTVLLSHKMTEATLARACSYGLPEFHSTSKVRRVPGVLAIFLLAVVTYLVNDICRRIHAGSQIEGTVHHGGQGMAAGS